MIKALILDVDGVIVGDTPGVNFPLPHTDIIREFKKIHASGIPIILCTAKFGHAVIDIAKQAGLHNPHITDGGALVLDPVDGTIVKQHVIDRQLTQAAVDACLGHEVFTEVYTATEFFIEKKQADQFSAFLEKRLRVLQKDAIVVDSLREIISEQNIIKIIAFATESDESAMRKTTDALADKLNIIWSRNPYLQPIQPIIMTASGVSKFHASEEALQNLGISFDDVLGAGDSASDWAFMEHCGYVATLANGDDRIKELVRAKGKNGFVAPHVNDNGMLDILRHFSVGL